MDAVSQHGGRARLRRERNILFKFAFFVLSLALALFGVLGWADAANVIEAVHAHSWEPLDPLWPFYATAAIGCVAAQIVAACAVVNLERLSKDKLFWRGLCAAFYAVAVVFAAYSADRGATVVLNAAHTAQRHSLEREVDYLVTVIQRERDKLPEDTGNTMTSRQEAALAIFEVSTKTERDRLPVAQQELAAMPVEPVRAEWLSACIFALFLVWAILEPWGYAVAERGRRPEVVEVPSISQPRQPFEVVEGGRATGPPTIPRPTQPAAQPKRLPEWLSLKSIGNVFAGTIAAQATQPGLNHFATNSTMPVNQAVETVVERPAAPILWEKLGVAARDMAADHFSERRIATTLTTRYGEKISRHQVRIWLGRKRSAA